MHGGPGYLAKTERRHRPASRTLAVAEVTSWNDQAEFKDMHAALLNLGFSTAQRQECYLLLATVMAIGNIQFSADGEGATPTDAAHLAKCAGMLQVDVAALSTALTTRTMGGGAIEQYKKPLEKPQAQTARNSLLMHIYSLVFDWCVEMINNIIAVSNAEACIGVLDIFGFENFKVNSFPQVSAREMIVAWQPPNRAVLPVALREREGARERTLFVISACRRPLSTLPLMPPPSPRLSREMISVPPCLSAPVSPPSSPCQRYTCHHPLLSHPFQPP